MAGIDDVTPKIEIEGGEEAAGVFTKIGTAAEQGFEQAANAAAAAESRLRQIEASAQRAGVSFEEMAARVKKASEDLTEPLSGGNAGGGGGNEGAKKGAEDAGKAAADAKKEFHELGVIGAEAFAKILEAAAAGNFTGVIASMFGKTASAIYEVVHAATEFVESQASMVETLNNLAQATGMTLAQIEGLKDAFASVGVSTSGFERAIGRLAMTIGNEWSSIQQTVRTAADEQTGSMLHMQEAALNLEKAYNSLGDTFTHTAQTSAKDALNLESTANAYTKAAQEYSVASTHLAQTAAHDALAVESAALSLRKAGDELQDFALKSQQNSVSLEGASASLESAQMNLRKARGEHISADEEKQLRIRQAEVAVAEAGIKLQEAANKKAREAEELEERKLKKAKAEQEARDASAKQAENAMKASLELAEKELAVRKASQEAADAQTKAIEDQAKATIQLKEAHLAVEKARLAQREASEKAHQQDLKDIPAIAKEVEAVATGYKKWADVMNHAEISAQNLTKAVILAASGGTGQPPKAMEVFKELATMFKNMGNDADSMNKKLELVQHTLASGFRAGQASAAQMLAILNRGPEYLDNFLKKADELSHVKFGGFDLHQSEEALTKFNSAFSSMNATIDQVKNRFAAIMAQPLEGFFDKVRESIQKNDGVLRGLANSGGNALKAIIENIPDVITAFTRLGSLVGDLATAFIALGSSNQKASQIGLWQVFKVAVDLAKMAVDGLRGALGEVLMVLGAIGTAIAHPIDSMKDFSKALSNSPLYNAGKKMTEDAGKDIRQDTAQLIKDAMNEEQRAASKAMEAANASKEAAAKYGASSQQAIEAAAAAKEAAQYSKDVSEKGKEAADKAKEAAQKGHESATDHKQAAEKHSSAADSLKSSGDGLITAGKDLSSSAGAVNQAAGALAQAASRVTAPSGKAAGGGHIRGPGGPTDDHAGLFALSDGEFVVRSAAVSHYGPQLFEALNDMSVGGYADGGRVGSGGFPMFPTESQFNKMWEPFLNKLGKVTNALEENARAMYKRETGKNAPQDWEVNTGGVGSSSSGGNAVGGMAPSNPWGTRSTNDAEDRYLQAKKAEREAGKWEKQTQSPDKENEYAKWLKGELEKRGLGDKKPEGQQAPIPVEVQESKGATQPFMPGVEKAISEAIKASTLGQFNRDGRETGAETVIRRAKEANPEKFAEQPKAEQHPEAHPVAPAETQKQTQSLGDFLKDVLKVAISPELFEKNADLKAKPSGSDAIEMAGHAIEKFAEGMKLPGDAYAGKYNVPLQTPGKLTEEDVFRQDQAKEQEQRETNKMSAWATGPAGRGLELGKIAHLIPDLVPGIFDKLSKEPGSTKGQQTADAAPLKEAAKAQTEAAGKTDTAMTSIGKAMESLQDHAGTSGDHQEKSEQAAEKTDTAAAKTDTAAEGLQTAAQALQQAATGLEAGAGNGADGAMAAGGHVRGPGGPTDDRAGLFALSNGEYVMRSAAVDHYGPMFFDALNGLSVGGFAAGGMVGGPRAPRSTIGPTGPTSVLNLTIDGNHFNGLKAPEHVASQLKSYAVTRQSSSAQRSPTWRR